MTMNNGLGTTLPVEQQILDVINELITLWTVPDSGATVPTILSPLPGSVIQLYPGTLVPADDCCKGQLSFRLVALSPVWVAAGRTTIKTPCTISWWNATIEVKLLRCAPVVSNNGRAPSASKNTATALQEVNDLQALLNGFRQVDAIHELGDWSPIGPEGGCVGGSWIFSMRCDAQPC